MDVNPSYEQEKAERLVAEADEALCEAMRSLLRAKNELQVKFSGQSFEAYQEAIEQLYREISSVRNRLYR